MSKDSYMYLSLGRMFGNGVGTVFASDNPGSLLDRETDLTDLRFSRSSLFEIPWRRQGNGELRGEMVD